MEESIKIKGSPAVAKFFEKILADKRERKEESRRKFKNGELKISE